MIHFIKLKKKKDSRIYVNKINYIIVVQSLTNIIHNKIMILKK